MAHGHDRQVDVGVGRRRPFLPSGASAQGACRSPHMTAGFPKGAIKGKARGSCSALYNLAREVKESHHILLDTWVSPSQCARGHSRAWTPGDSNTQSNLRICVLELEIF